MAIIYYLVIVLMERNTSQDRIQKKLAARHVQEDSLVLYHLSSSYFEGSHCPLAKLGYSRDASAAPTFEITTTPNHTQKRTLELIAQIKPKTEPATQFNAGFIEKTRVFGGRNFRLNAGRVEKRNGQKNTPNRIRRWLTRLKFAALTSDW